MGRFLLGVGLMVSILLGGLFVWHAAEAIHTPVSAALESAAEAAETGDTERAISQAVAARALWQEKWHASAAFSDHAPMDEIDGLFAQIENSGTELAALCRRIATLISAVAEAHSLTWWNLL